MLTFTRDGEEIEIPRDIIGDPDAIEAYVDENLGAEDVAEEPEPEPVDEEESEDDAGAEPEEDDS